MYKLYENLGTENPILGMIHLKPTLGYEGYTNYADLLEAAYEDAQNLQSAGFDGVIVENNYDLPHQIMVGPETAVTLSKIIIDLQAKGIKKIGLSVLWNDFKTALALAKLHELPLVRVPVFVDDVETNYGQVMAAYKEVLDYQTKISAQNVALICDIHVKHSKILSTHPIDESAKLAIKHGADALIITGKWTADAPATSDLAVVRDAVGDFPILVGSGATKDNAKELLKYANGIIVGTAVKGGQNRDASVETNIKPADSRVDLDLAKEFVAACK